MKYVDRDNLELFKELIEADVNTAIAVAQAKDYKFIKWNTTDEQLEFFKKEEPAEGDLPDFIYKPVAGDVSSLMPKIASALGGKIVVSKADGSVEESILSIDNVATKNELGTIPQGSSATDVIGYVDEKAAELERKITGAFTYKGSLPALADLPATGNQNGDVYHIEETGQEYVWLQPEGSQEGAWEKIGDGIIDLTAYSTTVQMNQAIEAAVDALDSTKSIEDPDNTNPLNVTVTQVDGVLSSVTGSIDPETFDKYGAAANVLGTATDTSAANTVYGAKAAARDVLGVSGDSAEDNTVFGAKAYADSLSSNYATTAQGALADTAVQPGDMEPLTEAEIRRLFQ